MRIQSYLHSILGSFSSRRDSYLPTVKSLNLDRYAGKWYEIARYTLWFEKGMTEVTAEYIIHPNLDYITVINSGIVNGRVKSIEGKAFVCDKRTNSKLKVQFFWPFKSDYWIIALDKDYQWTIVSNKNKSNLWVLSRTPQMSDELLTTLKVQLLEWGFDETKIDMTSQK